jgi:hypothetical protein
LDTKNFFTRIFAQLDELVICTHKPDPSGKDPRGIFWNRGSFTSIDDAIRQINQWDAEPTTTVYFGVGSFANHSYIDDKGRQKWSRKQENATWFKALALDLDIGEDKPYQTQKEGWAAMVAALKNIGMPMPMVISSGRGIHCYWPLTSPVKKEHWVKASTALRIALEENNVVIDTTKIHDPSMVLRPVGTHHKKQQPWKDVRCVADCPDYDAVALFTTLKPWFGRASQVAAKSPAARKAGKSSILNAVLNSNDVNLDAVAQRCKQVGALVASGGVVDAAGRDVAEPLWRASLGLAKHCVDVSEAVIKIAGKHKDFDLNASLNKLDGWNGTGPTTCAKFEQLCAAGCEGCPSRGKITSPAQLSVVTETEVVSEDGEVHEVTMPKGYVIQNGHVYREVKTEITSTDANGNEVAQEVTELDLVSNYEMHITGVYNDPETKKSAFRLAINYPMAGWKEEDHEMSVLATIGKDFSAFMLNRQVYLKAIGQQEKVRGYLMDYLTMVQSMAPTGLDYVAFGWQKDGSFLCGETVIGSPTGATDRRLRGAAARFGEMIKPHGSRDEWVRAMNMLNEPGAQTIRSAVLVATSGILGEIAGNACGVLSIYSNETTTGKTLALIAANSLIGSPKELFLGKNDTVNAMFKIRGVHNNLPCAIDELTTMDDQEIADLIYDLSLGREKIAMTKDRDLREPVTWAGPTCITTNISIHQKFENVQAGNDPLKARCMELHHHDRTFIQNREDGSSNGYEFFDIVAKNNGWAFPELAQAVVDMGGPQILWERGEKAFRDKFNFTFEPQERFYRTMIIAGWIMGSLGKKLGLFPFDVNGTTQHLLDHVVKFRKDSEDNKKDVFDTIGQFILEHNDMLLEASEKYGSGKEQVKQPAPEKAVMRVTVVYDDKNPVMPGSRIAINIEKLRQWLKRSRDGMDRIERELEANGALIAKRERVTMFKGCSGRSPGQTFCIIINLNHPRLAATLTGTSSREQSPVALAVLQGAA